MITSLALKEELLNSYSTYFNNMKIGMLKDCNTKVEHLMSCHIFLRVIDYYEDALTNDIDDKISITEYDYEQLKFAVKKYLQFSKSLNYD